MTTVKIASAVAQRTSKAAGRVVLALAIAAAASGVVGVTSSSVAGATAGPKCSVPGEYAGQPILLGVQAGQVITINCTGLPANTPFLFLDTSLLLAIDPGAQALLSGQISSPTALLQAISALPEINAASLATAVSSSTGTLTENYTLPTVQAADPNAVCPPTTEEYNSGLIGCAIAMINAETQKMVPAGAFLTEYKGFHLFPPNPTLHLNPATPAVGQAVTVSDSPGATTYWWLATLAELESLLAGSKTHGSPVKIKIGGRRAITNAMVQPATYSNSTFTPPKLSGAFLTKGRGRQGVIATLSFNLNGFVVSISAEAPVHIG